MEVDERSTGQDEGEQAGEITLLLQRWMSGDDGAVDQLLPHVYDNLRELAGYYMNRERAGHTLSPTDLVHDAYLRLLGENLEGATVQNRNHFFALAARSMRRILVEHARRYQAGRRASPKDRVALPDDAISAYVEPSFEEILAVDQALDRLRKVSTRQADIVELRYFGGFSEEDVSEVLGISRSTVSRDWRVARLFLSSTLGSTSTERKTELSATIWR
ncbi:MAG: ECF-type sigma factor [Holophagales bacterium]|nr:ECF-type sigma factor [Holophagales bacterium]